RMLDGGRQGGDRCRDDHQCLQRGSARPDDEPQGAPSRHLAARQLRATVLAGAGKDLGLALELARATDTPMRLAAICEREMAAAVARGWADRDASIFLTLQEERADVQVRLPPD